VTSPVPLQAVSGQEVREHGLTLDQHGFLRTIVCSDRRRGFANLQSRASLAARDSSTHASCFDIVSAISVDDISAATFTGAVSAYDSCAKNRTTIRGG
jgi:hypothetical protein